jgi:hypothetical protein
METERNGGSRSRDWPNSDIRSVRRWAIQRRGDRGAIDFQDGYLKGI